MKRFMNKKVVAIGLTVGLVLGGAGVAYAYFTSGGSGSGSATVGTSTNDITVAATVTGTLFPGGPTGTVAFHAWNANTTYSEQLSTITLTSITTDGGHSTCSMVVGTDFSMAPVLVGVTEGNLPPNGGSPGLLLTEPGALQMLNTNISQDPCKGAPLTLHFTTS